MPSNDASIVAQLRNTLLSFDINVVDSRSSLIRVLDVASTELARNEKTRQRMGSEDVSLWGDVRKLWKNLVRAQLTFWDGDDDSETEDDTPAETKDHSLCRLCISLARFTRNIVAGVPVNQNKAYENEPEMRRLLHYYTSWTSMQDEEVTFAARLLTQALSNIVTGNDRLMSKLWESYLNLPEDQVVIIRLLSSTDTRITLAVFTLIENCIHESKARTKMLTRTPIGARICVYLLDNMVKLYDAEETSEGGLAFDVGYHIFTRIVEVGLASELYNKLSIQGELVTPHQTTLMKIIDSYLQSSPPTSPHASPRTSIHAKIIPMLATCFTSLSSYAETAIRRALRPTPSELASPTSPISADISPDLSFTPPAELDVMLPKVCEMLVLVTQCIVSIILASQRQQSNSNSDTPTGIKETVQVFYDDYDSTGVVEHIVELLRLLDKFLPRINFGRPVESPLAPSTAWGAQSPSSGSSGFAYLKRDLVRLLGILSHENQAVQDRVRRYGGIEVVMNLCVVDEWNPYLREHAIFTLHNLLKDNPANQAVVEEIRPMGYWDENGVLKDTLNSVRR
ncbi:hypothetical protein E1B28_007413 [Marasmius oreades]|uniref:Ataxin-10 homolog n=1 Tax=Marasmius oreades TaxID=181124 RepID=A0A9P7S1W0_9AGAR|nr:uncharacterized protein E1B28_007413 [Marasmius oreades]KAG7093765.1 hypothetical protein E1B28_007413 [Marasmius oreades]